MSQMEVNEHGFVTFHRPDPARGNEIQLEYYKWALGNLKEMERDLEVPEDFFRSSRSINLQTARNHCEERIKFYTHRPTPMRSG